MKKTAFFLFIFLGIICRASSELNFGTIVGVYLPVKYIAILERTKHNPQAWAFNGYKNDELISHDVLIVDFRTVTACDRAYDGNTDIDVWEIAQYRFEEKGGTIFLIDGKKNRYKKISHDIFDVKNWSEHVCHFIGKIILDKLIQSGDVILEKDIVIFPALGNKKYRIEWQDFDGKEKMNLSLYNIDNNREDLYLEIKANEYIFYNDNYLPAAQIVWSRKL